MATARMRVLTYYQVFDTRYDMFCAALQVPLKQQHSTTQPVVDAVNDAGATAAAAQHNTAAVDSVNDAQYYTTGTGIIGGAIGIGEVC